MGQTTTRAGYAGARAEGAQHSTAPADPEILQLIVFKLGDQEFGAEIGQVREIIRTGAVTAIPDSPSFISGVANVRGEIIAVVDLKERLFLRARRTAASKHIVVTKNGTGAPGLMVDEVTEVLRIPAAQVRPAPSAVAKTHDRYVSGILTDSDRLVVLLDLPQVVSDEDLSRLTELYRKAREEGRDPAEALPVPFPDVRDAVALEAKAETTSEAPGPPGQGEPGNAPAEGQGERP